MKKTINILTVVAVLSVFATIGYAGSTYIVRSTGSAAVALNLAPEYEYQLWEARLNFDSTAGTGTIYLTLDAAAGTAYDLVLYSTAATGVQDMLVTYNPPLKFLANDQINLTYTNAGTLTYGAELVYTPSY